MSSIRTSVFVIGVGAFALSATNTLVVNGSNPVIRMQFMTTIKNRGTHRL